MSISRGNDLFRRNDLLGAIEEYRKIPEDHPLRKSAEFNISLAERRLKAASRVNADETPPGHVESLSGRDEGLSGHVESLPGRDEGLSGRDASPPGHVESLPSHDEDPPGRDHGPPGYDETLPVHIALSQVFDRQTRNGIFYKKFSETLYPVSSEKLFTALRESEGRLAALLAEPEPAGKPLVSVIMPTFNRAAIIGESIESVLDQHYDNWELFVCDDASTDNTAEVIERIKDRRIRYLRLEKGGAAAARNAGLARAKGELIAYLDSDNYWHPAFLARMVRALADNSGLSAAYASYIDFQIKKSGIVSVRSFSGRPFDHEKLLEKNYIDLNSFVHRRELYDRFGGFNPLLRRRQDYDLIIKYTWLRDPLKVDELLVLYQRNESLDQITTTQRHDETCVTIIDQSVQRYLKDGLPLRQDRPVKSVTILSWDLCRNHFSKAFSVAEALSADYDVQLVSFRFFDEEIFPPLKGIEPRFETVYFRGADFPEFFKTIDKAISVFRGDVIYAVKPRLPSLGIALLANQSRGTPIILEVNDLETVVGAPQQHKQHVETRLESIDLTNRALLSPYSDLWSQLLDPLSKQMPVLMTHNRGLDTHLGNRCLYMRNIKDEAIFDPSIYDRDAVRANLGFGPEDRVILFGGLIRKHKGIYELVSLVDRLADTRYKLLFVGSRPTPDQNRLVEKFGSRVRVLPPQDFAMMARINLAADLVILWLDPDVPASHYQMPYKATDAFAMGPAVIANDISDLGTLGRQEYLRIVPFGDWEGMISTIQDVFRNPTERARMRDASRRLYQRQFSYPAVRGSFELAVQRAVRDEHGILPVAASFARHFGAFRSQVTGAEPANTSSASPSLAKIPTASSRTAEDASITLFDVENVQRGLWERPLDVAIIIPTNDIARARDTARLMVKRAGMTVRAFIAEDKAGHGYVKTLNDVAERLDVKYFVYSSDNVWPGADWLALAYARMEETGGGLLAFNDGVSDGKIAVSGMLRKAWATNLYRKDVLFSGYKSNWAQSELSAIAHAQGALVYDPDCTLITLERAAAAVSASDESDRALFRVRFDRGFDRQLVQSDLLSYDRTLQGNGLRPSTAAAVVHLVDVQAVEALAYSDPQGVAVIMPCIDIGKGLATARVLLERAGMAVKIFVVEDTLRQGFMKTLNHTAKQFDVRYIVYLAEDAVPGDNWLKLAYEQLERTGKGLLAFNDGKWRGRVASFGLVRKEWVKKLYGEDILFSGYKSHRGDNELTAIARATDEFIYDPDAVLVEHDPRKVFRRREADATNFTQDDKRLFIKRFGSAFDGLVRSENIEKFRGEYLGQNKLA